MFYIPNFYRVTGAPTVVQPLRSLLLHLASKHTWPVVVSGVTDYLFNCLSPFLIPNCARVQLVRSGYHGSANDRCRPRLLVFYTFCKINPHVGRRGCKSKEASTEYPENSGSGRICLVPDYCENSH